MYKLFSLFLFIPFFIHAKDKDTEKIYSFLNQVISGGAIDRSFDTSFYNLVDEADFSMLKDELFSTDTLYLIGNDSLFTPSPFLKQDSIVILNKVNKYRRYHFDKKELTNVEVISGKKIKKIFKKYGVENGWGYLHNHTPIKHGYLRVSVPIFFDNGKKAIFYQGYHCGGLCGGGDVSIYENIDGIWIKKSVLLKWIS